MEVMLTQGDAASFMAEIRQQDKTLWEKVRDWFKNLAEKLRGVVDAYQGYTPDSPEGWIVAQMEDFIGVLQEAYSEALMDASENYRANEGKKNTTREGGDKYQTRSVNGKQVVWIQDNVLKQNTGIPEHQFVANYIAGHIGEIYTIIESGQKVYIGEDLPGEFTQSKYTQSILKNRSNIIRVKNRSAGNIGEMIEIATNRRWEKAKHPGNKDAKYGMYRYDTMFGFPVLDSKGNEVGANIYKAELVIRNASDGKKYLYDIVSIKKDATASGWLTNKIASAAAVAAGQKGNASVNKVSQQKPGVNPQSSEKRSDRSGVKMTREQEKATQDLDVTVDAKTESVAPSVLFSERTWTASDYVQDREKAALAISKAIGVTPEKATQYIDDINSIAKMIADDRTRLDYFSSPNRSSFVGNVEYGGSFDFSTLYKKRRLLTGTFTAIQRALPNTALTANEILEIRNRMKEAGLEVSFGLCYVEGSRANMGQFAKEFLRLYKQYYPDAWQPNMADVNTPDGISLDSLWHEAAKERICPEHSIRYENQSVSLARPTDSVLFSGSFFDGRLFLYFLRRFLDCGTLGKLLLFQDHSGSGGEIKLYIILTVEDLGGIGHMGDKLLSAVLLIVAGESDGVLRIVMDGHKNIGLRLAWMEIECKEQPVPGENNYLFLILQKSQITHPLGEGPILLGELNHIFIEIVKPLVLQETVFLKAPLAAAIMEAPSIAFTGEIDPFGMTKFVAHEVQISFTTAGKGKEADHLMKGDGAVNHRIVGILVHVRVHGGVCQTENQGFIANQSLVVAFHIGNRVFSGPAQAHITPHLANVPLLVGHFFHSTNPHIGEAHAKTVVKADTAFLDGKAHAGHTGHIFRDGNSLGIHLTNQFIGKLQIGDCFHMSIIGEVFAVGVKISTKSMVMIQHGGNSVKTETVKVILGHPEFQVAQQEVNDSVLAVIKAFCAPGRMVALNAIVEELPYSAVKHIDALGSILDSVGMNNVQKHPDTHFMGLVDQILQVLRLAEPAGGGKEIGNLVSEASVIRMLHNGHQLNGVVAGFFDMGKDNISKLAVRTDLAFLLGHAHMSFINIELLFADKIFVSPGEDITLIHNLCAPGDGLGVLNHPAGVKGHMLCTGKIGVYYGFYLAAVPQGVFALQQKLPVAVIQFFQGMTCLIPSVKIAGQIQLVGAGSPFTVGPSGFSAVEAIIVMGIGKFIQRPNLSQQAVFGCPVEEHPKIDITGKVFKLGIILKNTIHI